MVKPLVPQKKRQRLRKHGAGRSDSDDELVQQGLCLALALLAAHGGPARCGVGGWGGDRWAGVNFR